LNHLESLTRLSHVSLVREFPDFSWQTCNKERRRFIPMSIMKSQVVLSQVDFYHLISIYHNLSPIFDQLRSQFLMIACYSHPSFSGDCWHIPYPITGYHFNRNLLPVLGNLAASPWHYDNHPECDVQRDQVGVNMWKNGASPWHLEMVILDIKKRWFCNQQMLGVPGFEPFAWG